MFSFHEFHRVFGDDTWMKLLRNNIKVKQWKLFVLKFLMNDDDLSVWHVKAFLFITKSRKRVEKLENVRSIFRLYDNVVISDINHSIADNKFRWKRKEL